jgi:hypothetical protein
MTVDTLGRAVSVYRRTAASRSAIALVLANLIPLVGVLFFGWSLLTILVLYWVENGIVGFWNVPKIAMAQGSWVQAPPGAPATAPRFIGPQAATQLAAIPRVGLSIFFLFHYGVFWLGHGLFVFLFLPTMAGSFAGDGPDPACLGRPDFLPTFPDEVIPGAVGSCASPMGEILWGSVALGALALFISHGASFLFNFIGRGEYLTRSPAQQMAAPYSRVIVLHLTIIFGGMVVAFLGAPIGALLVLVGLKTAFDLSLHLKEHRATDRNLPPAIHGAPATGSGPAAV